jgi:hypothetical protein
MRNLLTKVPKSAQSLVATLVRTIFAQPDAELTRAQHARVVEQLDPRRYLTVDGVLKPLPAALPAPEPEAKKKRAA